MLFLLLIITISLTFDVRKIYSNIKKSQNLMTKIVVKSTLSTETLALKKALECCLLIKSLCELVNQEMHHDLFPVYC